MCNTACEEKLNGKLDVVLEKMIPIVEIQHDQENRIRMLEQSKCPNHDELNKKVDSVVIAQAINNIKLAVIIGISGSLGSMVTLTILGLAAKIML